MDLITIKAFNSVPEAHLARNLLEAEGVPAFVEEDAAADLLHLTGPAGEAKVQVRSDFAERARQILNAAERHEFNETPGDGGGPGEGQ